MNETLSLILILDELRYQISNIENGIVYLVCFTAI